MTTLIRLCPQTGATEALGRSLAALLRPGDVFALSGALGAGKTTLVRAVAAGLGADPAMVSSPTFVFINLYPVPAGSPLGGGAGGQLIHVDAYRLRGEEDLDALGWEGLFDPSTRSPRGAAAAMVEWPQRIVGALPEEHAAITIEAVGEQERRVTLRLPDAWSARPGFAEFVERSPSRCPTSGRWVEPLSPTYPFADARSRDADLYGWFEGRNVTSRPIDPADEQDAGAGGGGAVGS